LVGFLHVVIPAEERKRATIVLKAYVVDGEGEKLEFQCVYLR
jgi:hypothetical protein